MIMRLLILMTWVAGTLSTVNATLYPVSGDSSAVWSAIDLLPAGRVDSMRTVQSHNADIDTPAQEIPDTSSIAKEVETAPSETPQIAQQPTAKKMPGLDTVTTDKKSSPTEDKAGQIKSEKTSFSTTTTVDVAQGEQPPNVTELIDGDTATADTAVPSLQSGTGTLIITSVPDSVNIVINDVAVGMTPYHAVGFYPGLYEITLQKSGFEPFSRSVELQPDGTEFITANLSRESGFIFVSSSPESATVVLNDQIMGTTPFVSQPLTPGIYTLRIEATDHEPYTEQLGVAPNLTDTIQIALVSLKKPALGDRFNLKKSRNLRRIAFGATGAFAVAAGVMLNYQTKEHITKEKKALARYDEPELTKTEYTERYDSYIDATETTDRLALSRNIFYTVGIIGAIGFIISIPF